MKRTELTQLHSPVGFFNAGADLAAAVAHGGLQARWEVAGGLGSNQLGQCNSLVVRARSRSVLAALHRPMRASEAQRAQW